MIPDPIDWEAEQERFMRLAYQRAERAARRAFRKWHPRKRDDAVSEMVAKVWSTWRNNLEKGKDPSKLLAANIRWAILFVRYDRKVAGRARSFDVYDYRAGMSRQDLDGQGEASPTDRCNPGNGWIDWMVDSGADDPSELVAVLDAAGMTAAAYAA